MCGKRRGKAGWSCIAMSAVSMACAAPCARAFDRFWTSFSNANFNDTSKWLGGAVPGSADAAIFRVFGGTPGPYTVTLPGNLIGLGTANYVNDSLRIGPNTVTLLQSTQANRGPSTYTLNSAIQIGEGTGPASLSSSISQVTTPVVSVGFIAGSAATLSINAGAFNVTSSGAGYELAVGDVADGTLNFNGFAQMNVNGAEGNAVIGSPAGVTGTVNVAGASAIWNNSSNSENAPLVIGDFGKGVLNVSAGGQVNNAIGLIANQANSNGSATISGAGSMWINRSALTIGANGAGSLVVDSGGQVTSDSAQIGPNSTSTGTVQIMGAGSLFSQNADLTIGGLALTNGVAGSGAMIVSGGANVMTGGNGFVGDSGTGTAQVSGAGSKWAIASQFVVNVSGTVNLGDSAVIAANTSAVQGVVNIAGGATLNVNDYLQIGNNVIFSTNLGSVNISSGGKVSSRVTFVAAGGFGGLGQVNLDGVGSTWTAADQLYVGFLGKGGFQVTGGGSVTNSQCEVGVANNSLGTIVVDGTGSTWTTSLGMSVGVAGTGLVTASHGGVVTVGELIAIGPKGTIEGNSVFDAKVRNEGTVAPGIGASVVPADKFATLLITSDYTQTAAGKLKIDLNSPAQHDLLQIKGDAALAGTLELDHSPAFSPLPADRFTVLSAVHRSGTFDPQVSLGGGTYFLVPIYSPSNVVILAVAVGEKTWGVDANGNSSVAGNWIGGLPGAVDDKVAFSTVITDDRIVTVDAPFTAGSIYFDGAKNYLVQGPAAITLDVSAGSALLAAKNLHGAGTHTISAPLTFNDNTTIDVASGSTLRLTQPMNAAVGVAITKTSDGMLAVKNVRATGLSLNGGTVQVIAGGGNGGTSVVKSLSIAATARLDLNNNDLLIDYTGASPYTSIRDYLLAGLNTGVGGIISTSGQAAGNTVHAIVDNAHLHKSLWNGLSIDDTTIIAKYTFRGDANLDGAVGFADLVAVAQNYGKNGGATWDMGDFNYDGNVGFADLVSVAQNYGDMLPAAPIAGASEDFEADMAAAFASVPEPSVINGLLLGVAGFIYRRRRRTIQLADDGARD